MPVEREPRKETDPSGDVPSRLPVRAFSAPVRFAAVGLQVLAALNLLLIAAHLIFGILEGARTAPPLVIALRLTVLSGVPLAASWLLRRLLKATLEVAPPLLVLALRRRRFEIPLASIKAIHPWRLPLPGPGLALEMSSGRRFRYRLEVAQPGVLLSALDAALPAARSALGHASTAYAREKYLLARRRWHFWFFKFVLFPLALTVILFRLYQYIVFGGPFGEYHLVGPAAYLKSFGDYWAGTTGGLVVYASVWRLVAESLALPLTWALPSRARLFRRSVEILCLLVYFGAVPAFVLVRLLL